MDRIRNKAHMVHDHILIEHGGKIVARPVKKAKVSCAIEAPKSIQRVFFISPPLPFRHCIKSDTQQTSSVRRASEWSYWRDNMGFSNPFPSLRWFGRRRSLVVLHDGHARY